VWDPSLLPERQVNLRLAAYFDTACRNQVSGAPYFHLPLVVALAHVHTRSDEVPLGRVVIYVRQCIAAARWKSFDELWTWPFDLPSKGLVGAAAWYEFALNFQDSSVCRGFVCGVGCT